MFFLLAVFLVFCSGLVSAGVPNTPPTITPVGHLVVQLNTPLGPVNFTVNDAETNPDSLTLTAVSYDTLLIPAENIVFGGSGTSRTVTITPAPSLSGVDTIIITVSDGSLTASDTVGIKVNSPPRLDTSLPLNVLQGGSGTIGSAVLIGVDSDNSNAQIIFTVGPDSATGDLPSHGTVYLNAVPLGLGGTFTQADVNANKVTYTHDNSESTNDFFTFTLTDADGGIASDHGFTVFHFNVNIGLVNQPPVARDTSYQAALGASVHGILPASDPDSPNLTFSIVTNGTQGTAAVDSLNPGHFTYVPQLGAAGIDTFFFQVYDGALFSIKAGKVTINMQAQAPSVANGSVTLTENGSVVDSLSATDPNVPPIPLHFTIVSGGLKGSTVLLDSSRGIFRYTPSHNMFGYDTIVWSATNGTLQSVNAMFVLTIWPVLRPDEILMVDQKFQTLYVIDPADSVQFIISQGDSLQHPRSVVLEPNNDIFILDGDAGIVKVDPTNGHQTVFVPKSSFTSGPLGPTSLAMEHDGNLLVADGTAGIKRIDRNTANVSVVTSGDSINLAVGVAVDRDGSIVVGDASAFVGSMSKILRVNPVTGSQTLISESSTIKLPVGVTVDDTGNIFVCDPATFAGGPQDLLLKIDPLTGTQTMLNTSVPISVPTGLAFNDGGALYLVNSGNANLSLYRIDTATGNVTVVASHGNIANPFSLAVVRRMPLINIPVSHVQFGTVQTGVQKSDTVVVRNLGSGSLTISSVVSDSAQFMVSPTSGTIPPSGSQNFIITFKPTSADSISSRIVFTHNGFNTPSIITVTGSGLVTGVKDAKGLPKTFALYANYPNPFNPSTEIRFDLPVQSTVSIVVYNLIGAEVARLANHSTYPAGEFSVKFDAMKYSSGVYFYRIAADAAGGHTSFTSVRKMILLK
ncbi:MAG TPA: Ig-like domain-containing protein [Bacteroidota bacterium]|nr:Ig-like domain-containing protein [Bacteroidota bacterium]